MATSLDQVRANISKHGGFAKLTKYRVIFPTLRDSGVANRLTGSIGDIANLAAKTIHETSDTITLDMVCRSVTLPGKTINSIISRTNMREVSVVSGYTVDPCNIRFSETADYMVSRYIDQWLSICVDPNTYEIGYRSNYTRDIVIVALNEAEEPMYTVTLHNAYPKTKTLVDLSDFSANTITEVSAVFDYEDYSVGTAREQFAYELARIVGQTLGVPQIITNALTSLI